MRLADWRKHATIDWPQLVWMAGVVISLLLIMLLRPAEAAVPADFDKTAVIGSGLAEPTAFRFSPDGRILVAEKGGAIRLYKNNALQTLPMITLPTANSDERGLLGIELDPNFAANGYLYAAYTHEDNYDRLSRFHVSGDVVEPASERVLLKSDQTANVFHHGGEVKFGADGKLYWGLGMNLYNPNSQNLASIHGKILRINPDGTIPADNPFYNTPGANKAVWASGIRNPFRFDMLPATAGINAGRPIVGDVGGSLWEELDVIVKGGNYGWPNAEGSCTDCGYINPVFAYPHTAPPANAGSVSGVAVYTGNTFPSQYNNVLFYADYTLNFLKYLVMDSEFTTVLSDNMFDSEAGTPVQVSVGPDGNLYQLDIFPGALYKIAPSGGNRAPVAKAAATPAAGLAPLAVAFSSAGSGDPDGTPVTYRWDFKDGTTSTAANPSHTFTANGTYNVTLTVSDGVKSSTATVKVTAGNRLPAGAITSPVDGSKYNAGNVINYSGTGSDPEDGSLPASAFSWSVIFHHADHIHPFLGPITGSKTGSFTIPRNADNTAVTWYEIQLTVTDAGGLSHTSSVNIRPNLVNLSFSASPAGIEYTIDGIPTIAAQTMPAVVGVDMVLSTSTPQFIDGKQYVFSNWSDGGARTHTLRVPATAAAYQANFTELPQPPAPWTSQDIGARTVTGTSAYNDGIFTVTGGGNDIWGDTDEFRYVYQPLTGDGQIVARVTSQDATDGWAKSGVMIKESAAEGAKYALVGTTPAHGMHFQSNFNNDAGEHAYSFPNGWMKLVRTGNVLTGYKSADGVSWTAIGSTTLAMTATATIGLFVSSHNDTAMNTTTFDNVTVVAGSGGSLPAPWQRTDVGGALPTGTASYASSTGTFTVRGGGDDIWGADDQSSYVHRPLTGDGQIVARITGQSNTDSWAKSGVMIKETTTAGSKYAAMMVTPGNGQHFQHSFSGDIAGGAYTLPNAWVKLVRQGNVFTAYKSANGTSWTQVGSATIAMPATVTAGLFVNAHNGSTVLNTTTFDNVSLTTAGGGVLPAPWAAGDVGTPLLPGSATYSGGTFTVKGSGNDIWGADDQFQFVNQSLSGDGQIVARVVSQDNTDSWAKSGVMIKSSLVAGSAYSALMVTPGNGLHMQSNFNSDTPGGTFAHPNIWLKLVRTGNTITTFKSVDGVAWTQVGTATVTLPATAKIGLFVNAHNGSTALNTTVFDNVTVTAAGVLPAGWTSGDVGTPATAGSSQYSGGTFTLRGSGDDIWGTVDEFHYASKTLAADGSITARVVSQGNTGPWTKSGVMIKQSRTSGSTYAALMVTPGNGVRFQSNFNSDQAGGTGPLPRWLRLTRDRNTVSAYRSVDGTTWTPVGVPVTLTLTNPVTIGLFVNGHSGADVNTTVFDNVTVTP